MTIVNPFDSLERQNEKLLRIAQSLMRRVEQKSEDTGLAYQQFERAALLETQVRGRTRELERALDLLQESNARLEDANREIEAARANLAEAIETINEGFALFDPEERLVLFNSRFCRDMADISDELESGMQFADYIALISRSRYLSLPDHQSPEDWVSARLALHSDDYVVFNVPLKTNRWIQVSEHRTARGGTVILQTDVTQIMRLERLERDKLRDQQTRTLQATLDHLNQGVCIFDADLRLIGWNKNMDGLLALPPARAMHGLPFSELLDLLQNELTFHDGFDQRKLLRWSRTRRRPAISFELTRNEVQTFRVFAQQMPDRGFVISFTDVTAEHAAAAALSEMNQRLEQGVRDRTAELKVALSEAERANASKSRFVAAASHDLMQPLSAAKLFMASLSDHMPDAASLATLRRAESALDGVEKIIEALLDISRLDAGKAVFSVQPVALSAVLGPLRDQITPLAEAKGLSLSIPDADPFVLSDPSYLRRILQNLISNAVKYTATGRVDVGVEVANDLVTVSVADTGPGIAMEDRDLIFREFARKDQDAETPGLGLGLAIVERACKGLQHSLALRSEVGQGSRFEIGLQRARITHEPQRDKTARRSEQLDGIIILLVENDEALAAAMSQLLEENGAEVLMAHDGETAVALLREIDIAPDFVLLDYQLGSGQTGLELRETLAAQFGPAPAIIVSANRSEDLRTICTAAGVALMSKPVDREMLIAAIRRELSLFGPRSGQERAD
ncbi:PAS-domain containing protein [Roseobacter sp. HKCCA0434]|uniref:hybrid sensor histidine kinase/response regulator n=1 Tax=Roseobacter sp. HKCCA0434 TaxID=3079297 RepID=UPI0029058600|nr:PAS-domain containing protein [Roseobacter sp. HKCCA0434]